MAWQTQQLQDQKPKTGGPPLPHPPGVPHQNPGPEIDVSFAIKWHTGKKTVLKDFVKFFHTNANASISTLKRGPPMGLPQDWRDSEGFSNKLLPVTPFNSQGETKIKINGKPCQILVDTRATLSTLNPTCLEAYRWDPEKTGRRQWRGRILTGVSSGGALQCRWRKGVTRLVSISAPTTWRRPSGLAHIANLNPGHLRLWETPVKES